MFDYSAFGLIKMVFVITSIFLPDLVYYACKGQKWSVVERSFKQKCSWILIHVYTLFLGLIVADVYGIWYR